MGLGPGTGSPPSAISTPVLLHPQAACLRLAFFDVRACTTLGKTATAANKPNVTSVPQTLVFDILHLLEGISEDWCCRYEHRSRPHAKGRREAGGRELRPISGWYTNQDAKSSHISECVIAAGRKKGGAGVLRLGRTTPSTGRTRHAGAVIPFQGVGGKGSGDLRFGPFAA